MGMGEDLYGWYFLGAATDPGAQLVPQDIYDAMRAAGTALLRVDDGGTFQVVPQLTTLDLGQENDELDITDLQGQGWREWLAGLAAQEITGELNWTPTEAWLGTGDGLFGDFLDGAPRDFMLVFPNDSYCALRAYVAELSPSAPVDGVLTATLRLRGTGEPTWITNAA